MGGTSSLYPDPMDIIRGRMMLHGEGPWLGDDAKIYFGKDKDGYIEFNSGTGVVELHGISEVLPTGGIALPLGEDLTVSEAGDSKVDMHLGTGIFKTTTGVNTFGGEAVFEKKIQASINAALTTNTTITSASTKTIYPIDASGGTVKLTLPAAAGVAGVLYVVGIAADPGSYYVQIGATSGKIGGAAGVTTIQSTDAYGGMMLVSDGTNYLIVGSDGTWASV